MSTINDLSVVSTVSSADKFPLWSNANGVTRGLPVSVLDSRYITQDQINLLAISPTPEIFSAGDGIAPDTFVPGTTTFLTLANNYLSGDNIEVFFDGTFQGPDQYSLIGLGLSFSSAIPLGITKVYIRGGASRLTGAPSDGTVTDASFAAGSSAAIILPNIWTLKRFGCKVDGVTDDTANVIKAFASGELLIDGGFGDCVISGTVPLPNGLDGFSFHGSSRRGFRFIVQDASLPALSIASQMTGVQLRDFSISRVPTALVGGDGIDWTGSNSFGLISNVLVENCYIGFALGSTDYSRIEGCIAQNNQNDGFQLVNTLPGGQLQWNARALLSQLNVRHGYAAISQNTSAGSISMGTLDGLNSFGNSGIGFGAFGLSNHAINGIRLVNCFFGGDGSHEVFLDTFGGQHVITNVFTELCGTANTGPGTTTPASGQGSGFFVSANNIDATFDNIRTNGASKNGFLTQAGDTTVIGGRFTNNGIAGDASNNAGINHLGGILNVTGGRSTDTGQGSQKFGIASFNGFNLNVVGMNLFGNITAPTFFASNANNAQIIGCPGGSSNFSTDISKTGTVYTNP